MTDLDFSTWIPNLILPVPRNNVYHAAGKLDLPTSLVFADWLEENNEGALAYGWRNIGDRMPVFIGPAKESCYWFMVEKNSTKWGNEIPKDLASNLKNHCVQTSSIYYIIEYKTPFDAFMDLAQAIAKKDGVR